MLMSYRLINF